MADSKKKALIQAAAEMIRKAGKQTAGADTVLAHITPEEAAKLKAEGGSGRTDPVTGLPHFKQDKDSENSGSRAADNDSDNDTDNDKSKDKDNGKDFLNELSKATLGSVHQAVKGSMDVAAKALQNGAKEQGGVGKEQLPSLPSIPNVAPETLTLENLNPAAPVTTKPFNTKNAMKGASAGFMIGAPPGALVGLGAGLFGREEETHLVSPPNSLTPEKQATKSARESNGGNSEEASVKAPVADETTDTKKLTETVAAPTFDDFVSKARKKKNYMSTILGGGVPAGTPQGKKLLGS